MHTDYLSPAIRQLRDQQVRSAPREKQLEQADSAEKLLTELDPKQTYTCKYVCHRITNNGYQSNPDLKFTGKEARHDLRRFVEDLSDAAGVSASAAGQPVLTIDELARKFRVSTKTVSRWRQQGLVSRRFVFDGRKRIGFLQSSVDRFVAQNEGRVQRAVQFSQVTDGERQRIVSRARCLAQAEGSPATIARQIARETGRSEETIRYTLRNFNLAHPDQAVFPCHDGPLGIEATREVYRQYRRGESVQALARRFNQPRTRIRRILDETRAARIMELPLDYIDNEQFARLRLERKEAGVLRPLPENDLPAKKPRLPAGLPPYLASLYEVPLLSREQEMHLFRKMNYLKYRASALRGQLALNSPRGTRMDRIERLYDESVACKNLIIRANLRLVVSIAKRYVSPTADFFALVSDGNMSLIRAVEKFDFSRGNKFSTYATWALVKNFARTLADAFRHQDRFRPSPAEVFIATEDVRADYCAEESAHLERRSQVAAILKRLDQRELQIIRGRFGLTRGEEPRTLTQVGVEMGVTKERVRQIQCRAMSKLRKAAEEDRVEHPV